MQTKTNYYIMFMIAICGSAFAVGLESEVKRKRINDSTTRLEPEDKRRRINDSTTHSQSTLEDSIGLQVLKIYFENSQKSIKFILCIPIGIKLIYLTTILRLKWHHIEFSFELPDGKQYCAEDKEEKAILDHLEKMRQRGTPLRDGGTLYMQNKKNIKVIDRIEFNLSESSIYYDVNNLSSLDGLDNEEKTLIKTFFKYWIFGYFKNCSLLLHKKQNQYNIKPKISFKYGNVSVSFYLENGDPYIDVQNDSMLKRKLKFIRFNDQAIFAEFEERLVQITPNTLFIRA